MTLPSQHRSFFNSLLQFTHKKNIKNGKRLHAQIIKSGSSSCIYLSNSLVNLYSKCGHLPESRIVFEHITNKDIVSWNCLINGYSHHGSNGSLVVMELFHRMRTEDVLPNAHTFAGVFTAVAASGNLSGHCLGQQAHSLAVKTSDLCDVFVGSSLLSMYCKWGFVFDARKVFDEMLVRNSVTWATIISGYAKLGNVIETIGLFESMRVENETVNEFVMTSVLSGLTQVEFVEIGKQIHGLVIKDGLFLFVSVGNALVTMYAKCGRLNDALQTFEITGDKNSITWSAMVTGYAQCGDATKALELFSQMHFSWAVPSEYTIVGVLNACSDIGAVKEGKQAHGYALKLGFESQMFVSTAFVDMYAKCGCVGDARKGFDCLQEPDIVLWTSMIAGYVQNGEYDDALLLYGKMEITGIMPNELTMVSVLKACSGHAALEQGKQVHTRTIKYGFGLKVPIGSALSTMYAKSGSLEDCITVFKRMPNRDVVSWNAMISGLSQNGCGEKALELYEEMQIEGTKPDYVTFVNILSACSHMGFVEKGKTYFNMMSKDFGVDPRVEHYACMVDLLSRAGKLNEAKEFIESAKVDHGLCLWRILLSASRNYRNYKIGAYAGEKLMELGSLDSSAYILLSSIYTVLGRREGVERVRGLMKLRGVDKVPGVSWIELKNLVHVFVVGDQMHPQIKDIRGDIQRLNKLMKDEGYQPDLSSVTFDLETSMIEM